MTNIHSYIRIRLFCLSVMLSASIQSAFTQQDAYHDWLLDQLDMEYGITGGTWVLGDNETSTNTSVFTSDGITRTNVSVSDQPFSQAINLKTEDRPVNYYDYLCLFNAQSTVESGDVLLAVYWIRNLSAERGFGLVSTSYQLGESPYTSYLSKDHGMSPEWQQWFLPFEVTEGLDKSWFNTTIGHMIQEIEIGGVAVINFGNAYTVEELPQSTYDLDYEGRSSDAPWRAQAQSRIEDHRMSSIKIAVQDEEGNPVEGADVQLNMTRHAFGFGTAVALNHWRNNPQAATYREKILNLTGDGRSFNTIVFENAMKWQLWENDNWPGTKEQTVQLAQEFIDRGFRVRGHNLIWPGFQWLPDDIEENQNDPDYVRMRMEDHIEDILQYPGIQDQLTEWDVINEPVHLPDLADVFGNESIYNEIFDLARTYAPESKLYVNDYNIVTRLGANLNEQDQYKSIIEGIEQRGSMIDGVGFQAHMRYPLTPPETVYEIIEQYAAGGKVISITEYDARDVGEDIAGEYMRDFLTVAFSHPAVENFVVWGIWDPIHWLDDAPIFRNDWSLKPSGQAFIDLVFDEWWTNESGTTGVDGSFNTNGFLGEYIITASFDGREVSDTINLSNTMNDFTVTLKEPTSTNNPAIHGMQLFPNTPNPVRDVTQFSFHLDKGSNVQIILSDTYGRTVRDLTSDRYGEGRHTIEVDISDLSPGVYWYTMHSNGFKMTRNLLRVN